MCEARIGVLDGGADEGQRIRGGGGLRREPGAFCGVEKWIRPCTCGRHKGKERGQIKKGIYVKGKSKNEKKRKNRRKKEKRKRYYGQFILLSMLHS